MSISSPVRHHRKHKTAVHAGAPAANDEISSGTSTTEAEPIWGPWLPDKLRWNNIDWIVVGWMIAMHAGALAAPFYFNWQSLATCLVLHWLTASIGICLGYHRFLSHKSFKVVAPVKFSGASASFAFLLVLRVRKEKGSPDCGCRPG